MLSQQIPVIRRARVTLDASRVVEAVASHSPPRIVRSSKRSASVLSSPAPQDSNSTLAISKGTIHPLPSRPNTTTVKEGGIVLVVNASLDMARELTVELSQAIPGCSILFAPTLSTALWMLKRRSIDIILSSSILPDGPLAKLHEVLELMSPPPELVVLSELGTTRDEMECHPGYRFVELRRLSIARSTPLQDPDAVGALGADLRNDLNNPLQEIVAMAFVAQASEGLSPVADQALTAIERAAGNMAHVVNSLEEKIRALVTQSAA
jgi:hypothetical protein